MYVRDCGHIKPSASWVGHQGNVVDVQDQKGDSLTHLSSLGTFLTAKTKWHSRWLGIPCVGRVTMCGWTGIL